MRVAKNKVVVLRCPVQGIPLPNITWFKDGELLETDDRKRLLMSGRQLEISLAEESDTAWYTCSAENIAGSAQIEYNLTVIGSHFAIVRSGTHLISLLILLLFFVLLRLVGRHFQKKPKAPLFQMGSG